MIIKIILLLNLSLTAPQVESFLQSHGIRARVKIAYLAKPLVLGEQRSYFDELISAFTGRAKRIVIVPPFMEGQKEYILGLASYKSGLGMSVWNETNQDNLNRNLQSWGAFGHELGHLLKLSHTRGCKDLMDEDLLRCPNLAELTFTKKQIKEIRK